MELAIISVLLLALVLWMLRRQIGNLLRPEVADEMRLLREVDRLVAYGRDKQALHLLQEALARRPQSRAYQAKLEQLKLHKPDKPGVSQPASKANAADSQSKDHARTGD